MNKIIAQKAAHWWADQLRGNAKLDNGDKSEAGAYTSIFAALLQSHERTRISNEQIYKFEQLLSAKLEKENPKFFCIGVDYHPDYELSQCALKAGINPGMATFPWKTMMYIQEESIRISVGYQCKPVEI
jgi:hypothetical protein